MYTQFEAIRNRLFSFWGQKLCCWQVYLHHLAPSMRRSHHTDGWVPEWGWGADNDAHKVCVCVWNRERLQHHLNSVILWNISLLLFELCSSEVMGCFKHQSYSLLLTWGGTPGGWDTGKVRARIRLLGFPFSLGQSLMEWADKTVLCRCPLLLWLLSQKLKTHLTHLHCEHKINFCWINKGTALWQFIVCNELVK